MRRRLLLQGLLLSLWSRTAGAAHRLGDRRHALGEQVAADPPAPSSGTPGLSATELDALVGFGEVLVEGRTLPPAERDHLVGHIKESAQSSPEALALYRTTAALLERLAEGRFARLEIAERVALVGRHRLDVRGGSSDQDLGNLGAEERAVRTRAVPDLINGYWRSPAGWAAVAYQTFPGRCGHLTRYTRPEA